MVGGMCGGGHVGKGACMAGEMATAADGKHATEMHSCIDQSFTEFIIIFASKSGRYVRYL